MKDANSEDSSEERSWDQYKVPRVNYSSRRRPRYHGFLESYELARPDQSDEQLLEAYYNTDISGLTRKDPDYWQSKRHKGAVFECQWIRQGWVDEVTQSDQTPEFAVDDLTLTPLERSRGILIGLAIGDALGRPVEFRSAEEIQAEYGFLDSFESGGTHGQPAGTVTDDTEQALCIAASLANQGEWDPEDVAKQFVDWYNSSPFDIGTTTARSMENLAADMAWDEAGRAAQSTFSDERATNGSVMRCAPLAMAYPYQTDMLIQYSRESSRITHAHPRCEFGAAILNLTIANILTYTDTPLDQALQAVEGDAPSDMTTRLAGVRDVDEESLSASGDVTEMLEAALHYGLTRSSFFEAVTDAVNIGGDTDTIGAITGAIAGARFGALPFYEPNEPASIDIQLLGQTTVTGVRTLPSHIYELENGLGTFPEDSSWRRYISTLSNS